MRNLILLLLGIALGALGAVNVVNALRQRDAYPRGMMNVMQHHDALLRQAVQSNRCDARMTASSLAHLQELAQDLETAFYPDGAADAPFEEYSQRLRDALAAAGNGADCAAFAPAVDRINTACDACHRQYR